MSRKIFKRQHKDRINSAPFQFQETRFSDGPMELEAEAELDAFDGHLGGGGGMSHPGNHMGGSTTDPAEIIARAQKDADSIISEARERASVVEREAYEKGLDEGRKTGEIMAEQQLQAILTQYHHGLTMLDQMRELFLNQMQLDITELIIHTAEKVVCGELSQTPGTILPMVKQAIQSLKQRKGLIIFLNPEDHQFVTGMAENEQQQWFGSQCQLEVDPAMGRGSFRIETSAGELDANIQHQLQQLQENLLNTLSGQ